MNRNRRLISVTLGVLGLAVCTVRAGGGVNVTLLTGLTGENDRNAGFVIGNDGVVGGFTQRGIPGLPSTFSEASNAALWIGGTLTTLPRPPGTPLNSLGTGAVFGLSGGTAVGSIGWNGLGGSINGFTDNRAARWDNGVVTDLGVLAPVGSIPRYEQNSAGSINTAGIVVGNSFTNWDLTSAAWRASASSGLQRLEILPGDNSTRAGGINASGRIVGYSAFQDFDYITTQLPVYWDATLTSTSGPTAIPMPVGYNNGAAYAINDAGTVVGAAAVYVDTFSMGDFSQEPFYTDLQPLINIGGVSSFLPLPAGAVNGIAQKVNNLGWVLGTTYATQQGDFLGAYGGFGGTQTLWIGGEIIDIGALLQAAMPPDATLAGVSGMNDLGQFVGTATIPGVNGTSLSVPFIATIPEPSSLAVLTTVGLFVSRRRQR